MKIKGYSAFVVIASFFCIGVVAVNYIFYSLKKNVIDVADPTGLLSGGNPFGFPKIWQTASYYGGCLLLLPGLLLLILVTNEFTYRTHRQNIIDGLSRKQFVEVKLMLGLVIALASTLMVIITALLFGFLNYSSFSLSGFENVGFFFLKALTYNFVAVLMGVLIRRTGFAIAVYFIYAVLENGISVLLFVWAVNIKKDHSIDMGNMGNYLPMNASDGLLYSPFGDIGSGMPGGFLPADYTWLVLTLALSYLLLFFWWSRRRMLNSDL